MLEVGEILFFDISCRLTHIDENMDDKNKSLQLAMDPTIYATSLANVSYDEENVNIMLVSGNQGRRFQFSPKHAKRLLLLLQKQIGEFEHRYGEIQTMLPTSVNVATSEQKIGFADK